MSKYRNRMEQLKADIRETTALRDAQEEDDPDHKRFQREAKTHTRLWDAYNSASARLEAIDAEWETQQRQLRRVQRAQSRQESKVRNAAVAGGVLAVVFGLGAWVFGSVGAWVLAALLLAASVAGAPLLWGRLRERWADAGSETQHRIRALEQEYDELHPEIPTSRAPM